MAEEATDEIDGYLVKNIQFGPLPVRIVLQEGDGPCPLLAICNVLLLRGTLSLPESDAWVSHNTLVSILCDHALEINKEPPDASEEERAIIAANLKDGLKILSSSAMKRGIVVNPSLTSTEFELTAETACFDLFRIRLLHGWLIHPEAPNELHSFFKKNRFYNGVTASISFILSSDAASDSCTTREDDSYEQDVDESTQAPREVSTENFTLEQADLARAWFTQHESQLTQYGLNKLATEIGFNEVVVLWRNSHFYAALRFDGKTPGATSRQRAATGTAGIYTLISAAAFWEFPRFVFQKLAIHGRDSRIVDGHFTPTSWQ